MIGNYADAKQAYLINEGTGKRPLGWKVIGDGSTRTVWLSPDKVVYKVKNGNWDANPDEMRNLKRLHRRKSLPPNIRIPQANLYSVRHHGDRYPVIAMQYIKGRHGDYNYDYYDPLGEAVGLDDLFSKNVKKVGKEMWIIDLGC